MSAALANYKTKQRRPPRKGTHSCWECRRRKVKCTFAAPEEKICITCRRRGAQCASQVEPGEFGIMADGTQVAEPLVEYDHQPAGILYDTIILSSSIHLTDRPTTPLGTQDPPVGQVSGITSMFENITQDLIHALPRREDIEILLVKSGKAASLLCYQSNYKAQGATTYRTLKDPFSAPTLLNPELVVHPALLARQMLLFAIALQYLPSSEVIPGLVKHHHVIMEELADSAIKTVNMNDSLLGTLEGLECLIVECLYHIDCGNIRRAWVTSRRAVMTAQLLDLHQPSYSRYKVISDDSNLHPSVMWHCVVSIERSLSLLLGLPTSTVFPNSSPPDAMATSMQGDNQLVHIMMFLTAKILERNQTQGTQQTLNLTREIDGELFRMTGEMPSTFWQPPSFVGLKTDSMDAFLKIQQDQMCYYSVVNQLHLPYILCPTHSRQSVYSRLACVNASREILTREIAVRTFNPVAACSRVGDFISLIAGMTLVLAHLVSHSQEPMDNLLLHQRRSDRATVERALDCMLSVSALRDDAFAVKCAVLLKNLLAVEADAALGRSSNAHTVQGPNDDPGIYPYGLTINVPYVGIVRITREGTVSVTPVQRTQGQRMPEGVTIGGIGSIHINSSSVPDGTTDVVALEAPTMQATSAPSTMTDDSQITLGHNFEHTGQLFPDAAAGMDDWVFQGFDTAFFDTLMRGEDDLQLHGASGEGSGI